MTSPNDLIWTDWVPIDGTFGEWFLQSMSWVYERFGEDNDPLLALFLEGSCGNLTIRFRGPWFFRVLDEYSVALESGYRSYQRHSLYVIRNSELTRSYVENPYYLLGKDFARSELTHYRILCLNDVVDVLASLAPMVEFTKIKNL